MNTVPLRTTRTQYGSASVGVVTVLIVVLNELREPVSAQYSTVVVPVAAVVSETGMLTLVMLSLPEAPLVAKPTFWVLVSSSVRYIVALGPAA